MFYQRDIIINGTLVNNTMICATEDENFQKAQKEFIIVGVGRSRSGARPLCSTLRHHHGKPVNSTIINAPHGCLRDCLLDVSRLLGLALKEQKEEKLEEKEDFHRPRPHIVYVCSQG